MMIPVRAFLVVTFAVFLTGCGISLIDTQPAPQIYDLGAPGINSQGTPVSWQLIVEEPSTIRAFGTNRIALKRGDNSIQYYKGARWSDRGPSLFQARLIEALEDTGRIMSVGSETSGINANYRLKSTLRNFHADLGDGKSVTAMISISVKLLDARTREVIATTLLEKQVKARSGKIGDVVKAFDEAVQDVTREATEWVLQTGEAQQGGV